MKRIKFVLERDEMIISLRVVCDRLGFELE